VQLQTATNATVERMNNGFS